MANGFIYDYDSGKYIPATPAQVEERERWYVENPNVAPPGSPAYKEPEGVGTVGVVTYPQQGRVIGAAPSTGEVLVELPSGEQQWVKATEEEVRQAKIIAETADIGGPQVIGAAHTRGELLVKSPLSGEQVWFKAPSSDVERTRLEVELKEAGAIRGGQLDLSAAAGLLTASQAGLFGVSGAQLSAAKQQRVKEFEQVGALRKLEDFKVGENSYNVSGALASGISSSTIATALGRSVEEVEGMRPALTPILPTFEPPKKKEQMWRHARTGKEITQSELDKIPWSSIERDYYTRVQPALILPLDPKYREMTDEAERAAYRSEWLKGPVTQVSTLAGIATFGLPVGALTVAALPKIVPFVVGIGGATAAVSGLAALGVGLFTPTPPINTTTYSAIDPTKVGTAQSYTNIAPFISPTGEVDYAAMVKKHGEAEAARMLAQAGQSPTVPLEVYEKLSPDVQKFYTPTERRGLAYESGIAGVYGRGIERIYSPVLEQLREGGLAGQFGAGLFQYVVPHTLVTELYREKGALALAAMVPHFGPTAVYTGLTWDQQPWYGKVGGIASTMIPYAVGPAGLATRGIGRAISKVPVLGKTVGAVTYVPRQAFAGVGAVTRGVRLEKWAPWRGAYELSGIAGKAGLGRVPGLGTFGMRVRWWPGQSVPYSMWSKPQPITEAQLKASEAKYLSEQAKTGPWEKIYTSEGVKSYYPAEGEWRLTPTGEVKLPKLEAGYPVGRVKITGGQVLVKPEGGPLKFAPVSSLEPSARFIPGEGYVPGLAGKPAIVETVKSPFSLSGFFTEVVPKVGIAAAVTAVPWAATVPIATATQVVTASIQAVLQAANQMLAQGQITDLQHQKLVDEVQLIQTQATQQLEGVQKQVDQKVLTQPQGQTKIERLLVQVERQVEVVKQEVLTPAQLSTVERVEKAQKLTLQQQTLLQQQQQQQQADIPQFQQQIQQQQQQQQQLEQVGQQRPALPKAPSVFMPPPVFPEMGAVTLTSGGGLGGRGMKKLLKGGQWLIPGGILFLPEPFGTGKTKTRLWKPTSRKYGTKGVTQGGGIRL